MKNLKPDLKGDLEADFVGDYYSGCESMQTCFGEKM